MFRRAGILLVGFIVAACVQPASPASVSPSTGPSGSLTVVPSASPPTAPGSPTAPSESASGGEGRPDPSTFLQLCDRWPDDAEGDPISCEELVGVALAEPGIGEPVTRVETAYRCASADECDPRAPERALVTVVSDRRAVELEVTREADGSLAATAATAVDRPADPPFEAPPASAPAIDLAPAQVNDRVPLPLCGNEVTDPYGPLDTDARECFWNGVQAGSPVELISSSADTEGRPSTTVYRYAGAGGVEVLYNDETGWFRVFSGLEPFPGGPVFDLAGLTTAPETIPGG